MKHTPFMAKFNLGKVSKTSRQRVSVLFFNERKLVLGLQHVSQVKVKVKVKVQMEKFGNIGVLP